MTRRLAVVVAACVVVAALALSPVVLLPSKILDLFRPTNQSPYPFSTSAAQSFVAPTDRLSSVGFFLYFTSQFPGSANAQMVLTAEDSGAVLASTSREISADVRIPSHIFRPTYFDFAPIQRSKGVAYRATLTFSRPGVALWGAGSHVYGGGTAWVSELPEGFDFSFATRHDGTTRERLARLSHWAPLWVVLPVAVLTLAIILAAATVASRLATEGTLGVSAG